MSRSLPPGTVWGSLPFPSEVRFLLAAGLVITPGCLCPVANDFPERVGTYCFECLLCYHTFSLDVSSSGAQHRACSHPRGSLTSDNRELGMSICITVPSTGVHTAIQLATSRSPGHTHSVHLLPLMQACTFVLTIWSKNKEHVVPNSYFILTISKFCVSKDNTTEQ